MLLPHQLISSFCTRFSHYHLLFGGLGIAKMSQARTICYVKHTYIGWNCLVWPLQQQTLWPSGWCSGTWCPLVSLGEGAPAQESGRASPGVLPHHQGWEAMGLCGGVCSSCWHVPWCRNSIASTDSLRWGTCTGGLGGFWGNQQGSVAALFWTPQRQQVVVALQKHLRCSFNWK